MRNFFSCFRPNNQVKVVSPVDLDQKMHDAFHRLPANINSLYAKHTDGDSIPKTGTTIIAWLEELSDSMSFKNDSDRIVLVVALKSVIGHISHTGKLCDVDRGIMKKAIMDMSSELGMDLCAQVDRFSILKDYCLEKEIQIPPGLEEWIDFIDDLNLAYRSNPSEPESASPAP